MGKTENNMRVNADSICYSSSSCQAMAPCPLKKFRAGKKHKFGTTRGVAYLLHGAVECDSWFAEPFGGKDGQS